MKKNILFLFLILFALSCGKDPEIDQPVITRDGINLSINNPDADKELTIIYKAGTSSTMYGHDGDVYAHIGIISEGVWQFVPANWDENIAKCKMAKVETSPTEPGMNPQNISLRLSGCPVTPVNENEAK